LSKAKESLLVAIGVVVDSYRKILAVQLGRKEKVLPHGKNSLKDLKKRGLRGEHLELGVMDGLAGLENAFIEAFRNKQKFKDVWFEKLT